MKEGSSEARRGFEALARELLGRRLGGFYLWRRKRRNQPPVPPHTTTT